MKYTCTTEINLPISQVVNLWKDEANFGKWQDGFIKIVHISGEPGTAGAKSKIYLEQGKRNMELLETIVTNNLPHEKTAVYEHIHMTNTLTTKFTPINSNRTQYIAEVNYTKINSILPKFMALLFPGVFKKQNQKWLDQFRIFAEEKGGDIPCEYPLQKEVR